MFYNGASQANFTEGIDKVSAADVQNAVSQALKTPLTVVAQGG